MVPEGNGAVGPAAVPPSMQTRHSVSIAERAGRCCRTSRGAQCLCAKANGHVQCGRRSSWRAPLASEEQARPVHNARTRRHVRALCSMAPAAGAQPPRCRSCTPVATRGTRGCATPPIGRRDHRRYAPAGDGAHGRRLRGLIAVLCRAGPRIQAALALAEADLDTAAGHCWCGATRAAAAARSAWTTGRGSSSRPGSPGGSS
jgi:hypothetical protein